MIIFKMLGKNLLFAIVMVCIMIMIIFGLSYFAPSTLAIFTKDTITQTEINNYANEHNVLVVGLERGNCKDYVKKCEKAMNCEWDLQLQDYRDYCFKYLPNY